MAFSFVPPAPRIKKINQDYLDLKTFEISDVLRKKTLGQGSFGSCYLATYQRGDVAIKEILADRNEEIEKLFLKEARIMQCLDCKYVTKMLGVCYQPLSIMTEYCIFSFRELNATCDINIHTVEQFLRLHSDDFIFNGIEQFFTKIAKDVAIGMSYIHKKGIACRDIKPSNVLISNRHYMNMTGDRKQQMIIQEPLICKITDFGEARSNIMQTKSLVQSRTNNLRRGTLTFMPPECLLAKKRSSNTDELIMGDIWSYGMLLFSLINPDLASPFMYEIINDSQFDPFRVDAYVANLLTLEKKPTMSNKYEIKRSRYWYKLQYLYNLCSNFNLYKRPCAETIVEIINDGNATVVNLRNSQETALVTQDSNLALNMQTSGKANISFHAPENDGTNSCTFLCLKIASLIANLKRHKNAVDYICTVAESTIESYPTLLNKHRDINDLFDPWEALEKMKKFDEEMRNFNLEERLDCLPTVFSNEGMSNLYDILISNEKKDVCFIYVCHPYAFLIGCKEESYYILDTHPVSEELGGNNSCGALIASGTSNNYQIIRICSWLYQRLNASGVKIGSRQSLSQLSKR